MTELTNPRVGVGTRWRQPRTGRILEIEHVDGGLIWGRMTTRGGNWTRHKDGLPITDFMLPFEDSLLDNLMGWRWVRVAGPADLPRKDAA